VARKEQITITLDRELTEKLRKTAERRNASLSSVIESYLKSVDAFSHKTDIQRVLDLVKEIRDQLQPPSSMDSILDRTEKNES
jgi:hypothetical protein